MKKMHAVLAIAITLVALGAFMTTGAMAADKSEDAAKLRYLLCCPIAIYK